MADSQYSLLPGPPDKSANPHHLTLGVSREPPGPEIGEEGRYGTARGDGEGLPVAVGGPSLLKELRRCHRADLAHGILQA